MTDPEKLAAIARDFLHVQATSEPRTGLIVIRGSKDQVALANNLLGRLTLIETDDGPGAFRITFIKRLRHASATTTASILDSLDAAGAFRPLDLGEQPVKVVADEADKLVIIQTERQFEQTIRSLIDDLDSDTGGAAFHLLTEDHPKRAAAAQPEKSGPAGAYRLQTDDGTGEMIAVKGVLGADPDEMVRIVSELFPVKAVSERHFWHLVLRGKPAEVEAALLVIEHFDISPISEETPPVFTVHLKIANAPNVAKTLQEMIRAQIFGVQPAIAVADQRTNTIVVCIDRDLSDRVRNIIEELDISPNQTTQPASEIRIEGRTTTRP